MIVAILRVKNEARWIERCLRSLSFADKIIVLDDHSTDDTSEIAGRWADVHNSPFTGLDEPRDRNFLLGLAGTPDWIVCPDGDEEFTPQAVEAFRGWVGRAERYSLEFITLSFPVLYLWNDERTVRWDGVYRQVRAVRAFQFQPSLRFPKGDGRAGFHCGTPESTERGMRRKSLGAEGPLLHFGYIDAAVRARKLAFYRDNDPANPREDYYRHLTQGDPDGEAAGTRLKFCGPLQLKPLEEVLRQTQLA